MDEAKWLTCTDPVLMLKVLQSANGVPFHYRVSDRKLRLFAVACCRMIWDQLTDQYSQQAVEVAERYADGKASEEERQDAWSRLWVSCGQTMPFNSKWGALRACDGESTWICSADSAFWCKPIHAPLVHDIFGNPYRIVDLLWEQDCKRDQFGVRCNVYSGLRQPYPKRPHCGGCGEHWKSPWLGPQVLGLAQAAYDVRQEDGTLDPMILLALADALEEAGCHTPRQRVQVSICGQAGTHEFEVKAEFSRSRQMTHMEPSIRQASRWAEANLAVRSWHRHRFVNRWPYLLRSGEGLTADVPHPLVAHLRGAGPHYRGCWAVDTVLGRA